MSLLTGTPFFEYYETIYGSRWSHLLAALEGPEFRVARLNLNSNDYQSGELVKRFSHLPKMSDLDHCFLLSPENLNSDDPVLPRRTSDGLLDCYIMDPASIFVALALHVRGGHVVLDMCAAPGGKTLILAEALRGNGQLIANELSASRRERLTGVIRQYIPINLRTNVWVKGKDGAKFGLQSPDFFDRILLDAPCSGERHLLSNLTQVKGWSLARVRHLAFRQYNLLTSAALALKAGGRIVYSTCSINPQENDDIIRKLVKKKSGLHIKKFGQIGGCEETEFGFQYLPDRCGFGPMYFSVLEKKTD